MYAYAKLVNYIKLTNTYHFEIKDDHDGALKPMVCTGDEIDAMRKEYDSKDGAVQVQHACIMCILHDQDEIESDEPQDFIGQSFEICL